MNLIGPPRLGAAMYRFPYHEVDVLRPSGLAAQLQDVDVLRASVFTSGLGAPLPPNPFSRSLKFDADLEAAAAATNGAGGSDLIFGGGGSGVGGGGCGGGGNSSGVGADEAARDESEKKINQDW